MAVDNSAADDWPARRLPNFIPDFPADLPALDTPLSTLQRDYRFCYRCWLPLAPVRRCRCAPEPPSPADDATAQIAATVEAHPALREMAQAVAGGHYAGDTATREARWLGWLRWLYEHQKVGEHAVWTYELSEAE